MGKCVTEGQGTRDTVHFATNEEELVCCSFVHKVWTIQTSRKDKVLGVPLKVTLIPTEPWALKASITFYNDYKLRIKRKDSKR